MRVLPLVFALFATMLTIYASFYALFAVVTAAHWAEERGIDVQIITHAMLLLASLLIVLPRVKHGITGLRGKFR
jgi:hypothetical protein